MSPEKLIFSDDVMRIIRLLCQLAFNAKSEQEVERIFGMSHEQLDDILKKIVNALPEVFFKQATQKKLEEIKNIFAREFVFFSSARRYSWFALC